jgi:hypothetical protein
VSGGRSKALGVGLRSFVAMNGAVTQQITLADVQDGLIGGGGLQL